MLENYTINQTTLPLDMEKCILETLNTCERQKQFLLISRS